MAGEINLKEVNWGLGEREVCQRHNVEEKKREENKVFIKEYL